MEVKGRPPHTTTTALLHGTVEFVAEVITVVASVTHPPFGDAVLVAALEVVHTARCNTANTPDIGGHGTLNICTLLISHPSWATQYLYIIDISSVMSHSISAHY